MCTCHVIESCEYVRGAQAAMAVFDVPEAIAVARATMCSGGGLAALTRLQVRAPGWCGYFNVQ